MGALGIGLQSSALALALPTEPSHGLLNFSFETEWPRMAWYSIHDPEWPQAHSNHPASEWLIIEITGVCYYN